MLVLFVSLVDGRYGSKDELLLRVLHFSLERRETRNAQACSCFGSPPNRNQVLASDVIPNLVAKVALFLLRIPLSRSTQEDGVAGFGECGLTPQECGGASIEFDVKSISKFSSMILYQTFSMALPGPVQVECDKLFCMFLLPEWPPAYPIVVNSCYVSSASHLPGLKYSIVRQGFIVIANSSLVRAHQIPHNLGNRYGPLAKRGLGTPKCNSRVHLE
jgi:hypothetical protein